MIMSLLLYFVLPFFTFFFFFLISTRNKKSNYRGTLPPGPRKLPVFGNIFQGWYDPHRTFAALAKTYGPVMTLQLGSLTTIVISSAEAAKEVLKTQDHLISARTYNDPIRVFDHHEHSVDWSPPNARWRFLRKITITTKCSWSSGFHLCGGVAPKITITHLLSTQRLNEMESLRMKKVNEFIVFVNKCCERGEAFDIARAFFVTALNIISNALFSNDSADYESESSHELYNAVVSFMNVAGKPNVGDYFPFLRFLDLQGARKEAAVCVVRMYNIFQEIIDVRIAERSSRTKSMSIDMLDTLLDIIQENKEELSIDGIKHFLQDMFTASTDTNSTTTEWAMSELLCNPEKMVKAQSEIRQVIGQNGVVQESDIPKLPYLQAILKETLRMHPASPFIPRKSESDVYVFGFLIPKDTPVLVNAWAIGRDPSVWENPTMFEPERFMSCDIDVKGQDFELIPFGSGRRICPGMSMALRTMAHVLGSLLYSFDWEVENGNIDMSEEFGVTLRKAKPLRVLPIKRHEWSSKLEF